MLNLRKVIDRNQLVARCSSTEALILLEIEKLMIHNSKYNYFELYHFQIPIIHSHLD